MNTGSVIVFRFPDRPEKRISALVVEDGFHVIRGDETFPKLSQEDLPDEILNCYYDAEQWARSNFGDPMFESTRRKPSPAIQPDVVEASEKGGMKSECDLPPYHIENFALVRSQSRNDCGVVTIANLLQISHQDAKVLAFQHGWSSTSGIEAGFCELVMESQGFELRRHRNLEGLPLRDVKYDGCMLIAIPQHIMPLVNGELYNHGDALHHRVVDAVSIHRKVS